MANEVTVEEIEVMQHHMRLIMPIIASHDVEVFEAALAHANTSRMLYDTLVPITDPSRWMRDNANGTKDHHKAQSEIMRHLIEIRKQLDVMQGATARYIERGGSDN